MLDTQMLKRWLGGCYRCADTFRRGLLGRERRGIFGISLHHGQVFIHNWLPCAMLDVQLNVTG